MKWYTAIPLTAAALLAAGCSDGGPVVNQGLVPKAPSLSVNGAAFTTVDETVDGTGHCANGNPNINCNIYDSKDRVWLNGGPASAAIGGAGNYLFAVLAPSGQGGNDNPNDGMPKNLSDVSPTTGTGAGDLYLNRVYTVDDQGNISAYGGTHTRDGNKIRLMGYDDTPNMGGVYILAVCNVGDAKHENSDDPMQITGYTGYPVTPSDCKYDAFKVRTGGGTSNELPDLLVEKTPASQTVLFGGAISWSIKVTAIGPTTDPATAADNVKLTDALPASLSYGSTITVGGNTAEKPSSCSIDGTTKVLTCSAVPHLTVGNYFTVTVTTAAIADRTLCGAYNNTASADFDVTLNGAAVTLSSSSDQVTAFVACPLVKVEKTADAAWQRTYAWTADKKSNGASTVPLQLGVGKSTSVPFTVTVTGSATDAYSVSGGITVTNTGNVDVALNSVSDAIDNAIGSATVQTCSPVALGGTLAKAGGTTTCSYSKSGFTPAVNTTYTNTATAMWSYSSGGENPVTDAGSPTGTKTFSYSAPLTTVGDRCVLAVDKFTQTGGSTPTTLFSQQLCYSGTIPLGAIDISVASTTNNVTVSGNIGTWTKSLNQAVNAPSGLGSCGTTGTATNVATISGTNIGTSAPATVTVNTKANCGCTPGYWKNNDYVSGSSGAWKGSLFSSTTQLNSTSPLAFGLLNPSQWTGYKGPAANKDIGYTQFGDALVFPGGDDQTGKAQNLLRIATAALLNATWASGGKNFGFPMTDTELRNAVNTALSNGITNPAGMTALQTTLDKYNNYGCPIDSKGLWIGK